MVKCKIKLFMREDETLAGRSKKDESRDPEFYEVPLPLIERVFIDYTTSVTTC